MCEFTQWKRRHIRHLVFIITLKRLNIVKHRVLIVIVQPYKSNSLSHFIGLPSDYQFLICFQSLIGVSKRTKWMKLTNKQILYKVIYYAFTFTNFTLTLVKILQDFFSAAPPMPQCPLSLRTYRIKHGLGLESSLGAPHTYNVLWRWLMSIAHAKWREITRRSFCYEKVNYKKEMAMVVPLRLYPKQW